MESTPLLDGDQKPQDKVKLANLLKANIVFLLYHLAVNMYDPSFTQYLYKRFHDEVFANSTVDSPNSTSRCQQNTTGPGYALQELAQQRISDFLVMRTVISGSTGLICCMFLGAYSDYLGRRFLFVVSLFGEGMRNAIDAAVIHWELDVRYTFIGEVFEGVFGGYNGVMLASFAYTADNTPPKKSRTIALALVDLTTYTALALSQIGTGYIIQYLGYEYPILITIGLISLAAVLVILILPETIHRTERTLPSPWAALKNVFGFYFTKKRSVKLFLFWLAAGAYFFTYFVTGGLYNVEYLFQMNLPLCWGSETIGYFNMAGAIARQILGVPFIKLLHCCMGDGAVALLGSLLLTAAYVLHGFAYNDFMMFAYLLPVAASGPLSPALRAIMSRMAPPELQGSLFASVTVINVISSWSGVTVFNEIYGATVEFLRGFVYFAAAIFMVIVALLTMIYMCASSCILPPEQDVTVVINDQDWKPRTSQPRNHVSEDSQV